MAAAFFWFIAAPFWFVAVHFWFVAAILWFVAGVVWLADAFLWFIAAPFWVIVGSIYSNVWPGCTNAGFLYSNASVPPDNVACLADIVSFLWSHVCFIYLIALSIYAHAQFFYCHVGFLYSNVASVYSIVHLPPHHVSYGAKIVLSRVWIVALLYSNDCWVLGLFRMVFYFYKTFFAVAVRLLSMLLGGILSLLPFITGFHLCFTILWLTNRFVPVILWIFCLFSVIFQQDRKNKVLGLHCALLRFFETLRH